MEEQLFFFILSFISIFVIFIVKSYMLAYESADKIIVALKKREKSKVAKYLINFSKDKNVFFISCLNTLFFFIVLFFLFLYHILEPVIYNDDLYLYSITTIITICCLILFLHFIPNILFSQKSNHQFLFACTKPMYYLYKIFYPISSFYLKFTQKTLQLINKKPIVVYQDLFPKNDINDIYVNLKKNSELVANFYVDLFEKALNLPNIDAKDLMVTKKEIISIDQNATIDELYNLFNSSKLSKIIVHNEHNQFIGYIHQLDLFKNKKSIQEHTQEITSIKHDIKANVLLPYFINKKINIALVEDNNNNIIGLITLKDVLQEIFGRIYDEQDFSDIIEKQISEKTFIFSTRIKLETLNQKYNFEIPYTKNIYLEEYIKKYLTHNHPVKGEKIKIDNLSIEFLKTTKFSIDIVKIKVIIN